MTGVVTILTYHRILPAERAARYPFPSLAIPLEVFREHVAWLSARCSVLPLREALAAFEADPAPARPIVAVTFDDGYDDAFVEAAPVLDAHGVRGTFFATVQPIERGELLWFDRAALVWTLADRGAIRRAIAARAPDLEGARPFPRDLDGFIGLLRRVPHDRRPALLAALDAESRRATPELEAEYRLMTIDQVIALSRRGHEIASHTLTHPFLTDLDSARLEEELRLSRRVLSGWTGRDVDGFCYPAGDVDARAAAAVRDAGYAYACTTGEGPNRRGGDPMRLRRGDITAQRVADASLAHDPLGFRMEISGLRHGIRRLYGRAS